jgi:hypothetical protein
MSPLNDGEYGDAEEGKECPEERHYNPSREEFLGELVGCAIETVASCQYKAE